MSVEFLSIGYTVRNAALLNNGSEPVSVDESYWPQVMEPDGDFSSEYYCWCWASIVAIEDGMCGELNDGVCVLAHAIPVAINERSKLLMEQFIDRFSQYSWGRIESPFNVDRDLIFLGYDIVYAGAFRSMLLTQTSAGIWHIDTIYEKTPYGLIADKDAAIVQAVDLSESTIGLWPYEERVLWPVASWKVKTSLRLSR